MEYRAEIDGLRAVAVLSVVFFHLGWNAFPGGFVGVDVFFVISGYLITKRIVGDLDAGRFTFRRFYMARVRRILPAMLATVALVFVAATILFSPTLLAETGQASIATVLSAYNILLFLQVSYFDTEALFKPLLHMWSLGVEEQFYLVWPALLLAWAAVPSRSLRLAAIGILAIASVAASQWAVEWSPSAAYYLTPFRVHEFLVGAVLVRTNAGLSLPAAMRDGMTAAGVGLIAYAVVVYSEATPFPGVAALVPCLGAGLVIFAGRSRVASLLLCNRAMVGVGLISYSLYLVHWPVIVFYRYAAVTEGGTAIDIILIASMILLAVLMYRYVETPFRVPAKAGLSSRTVLAACCGAAVAISATAAAAVTEEGWPSRMAPEVAQMVANIKRSRAETWDYVSEPDSPGQQPFDRGGVKVLILGDSHSKDLFNAVYLNPGMWGDMQFRRLSLPPNCLGLMKKGDAFEPRTKDEKDCVERIAAVRESSQYKKADAIIGVMRWYPIALRNLDAFKEFAGRHGARLALTTRKIEFADVPELVSRMGGIDRAESILRSTVVDKWRLSNKLLTRQAGEQGIPILDLYPVSCPGEHCPLETPDHQLAYLDGHHWSLEGARYFGRMMAEAGFFDGLRDPAAEEGAGRNLSSRGADGATF
ncbi:acyltransferase family protein [Microbaculum marinum]|uniref:Acyltransferase family protein n=1 Tax=Microbaculum marinum TaxID=1764581 RepID=A0AAW9S3I8_9HYPH